MLSYKEIFEACEGTNETGNAKCAISLSNEMWKPGVPTRQLGYRDVIDPVVRFYKHGTYFQIDLEFESAYSPELSSCWTFMESIRDIAESNTDPDSIPVTVLSIIPLEYRGEYSVLCVGAIFWTLQPKVPGAAANVIRLVFDAEDVIPQHAVDEDIAKTETDDINIDQSVNEVEDFFKNQQAESAPVIIPKKTEENPDDPSESDDSDGF